MRFSKFRLMKRCQSERGQAITEYLLVLAMVLMMAIGLKRLLGPFFIGLQKTVGDAIEQKLSKGNLHKLDL